MPSIKIPTVSVSGTRCRRETGLRIDEAADQPGGRHAVDARPAPRHPQAIAVVRRIGCAGGDRTPRTRGRHELLQRLERQLFVKASYLVRL
jgi:hypothetical protein